MLVAGPNLAETYCREISDGSPRAKSLSPPRSTTQPKILVSRFIVLSHPNLLSHRLYIITIGNDASELQTHPARNRYRLRNAGPHTRSLGELCDGSQLRRLQSA